MQAKSNRILLDLSPHQTRWKINLERNFGSQQNGMGSHHFGGGEKSEAFIKTEVQVAHSTYRQIHFAMPNLIRSKFSIKTMKESGYRIRKH